MNGPPILACASSFTFLRVFVRPTDCLRVRLSVFMSMFCLILSFSALVYATLLSLILSVCVSLSLSPLFSLALSPLLSLFSLSLSHSLSPLALRLPSLSLFLTFSPLSSRSIARSLSRLFCNLLIFLLINLSISLFLSYGSIRFCTSSPLARVG